MSKKNYTFDTVVRSEGHTFLLAARNNQSLSPLSQQAKDQHYPGIDTRSDRELIETYNSNIVHLDATKTAKERKDYFKGFSLRERRHAIHALCSLPSYTADPHYGYACLMIALLARILHYVPQSIISGTPAVFCGSLLQVPSFLQMILLTVNGPEQLHGKHFTLCRPSCLEAQRPFPHSAALSHTPHDYIGGTLRIFGEDYRFWLPLWGRAVCIAPGLPADVQKTVLDASFSVIPFYCNNTKGSSTWDIRFPEGSLLVEDASVLDSFEDTMLLTAAILDKFFQKCANKSKHIYSFLDDIDTVIPSIHLGKSITGTLSAESRVFAAGLCVYRAFLAYVRDKGWISPSEYNEFLTTAQDAIFPQEETLPTPKSLIIGKWDSLSAFWPFFEQFLQEYKEFISVHTPCSANTVAAVHTLRGERDPLLIIPRYLVESAYHTYCDDHGLFNDWSGSELTNCVLGWEIGAKRGSGNEKKYNAWSHNYYHPDSIPDGQKEKIICLGLPIKNLPAEIQNILPTF